MILTVTANPAYDLALEVPELATGEPIRSTGCVRAAGGKGLNVSRVLRELGHATKALVWASGRVDPEFFRIARADGTSVEGVAAAPAVRTNLVLLETTWRRGYKINGASDSALPQQVSQFVDLVESEMRGARAVVLAGSAREGAPDDLHARFCRTAWDRGALPFVDASGPWMRAALDGKPQGIKVNRAEFAELLGAGIDTTRDACQLARAMVGNGIGVVCITAGSAETVLATRRGVLVGHPPAIEAIESTGAGDSFLAGLVSALLEGATDRMALALGLACGAACAASPVFELARRNAVEQLLPRVQVLDVAEDC